MAMGGAGEKKERRRSAASGASRRALVDVGTFHGLVVHRRWSMH